MIYLIGALVVLLLLGKFFKKTFLHVVGLLIVEIVLFLFFPNLLIKFAELVAVIRHAL